MPVLPPPSADAALVRRAPAPGAPARRPAAGRTPARPSHEDVRAALAEVIEAVAPQAGALEFIVDEVRGRTIVRVVDKETKAVVRQIPAPEMLAIRRSLERMQGILIRLKA
jgi:flagellar protein FlaG